MTLYSKFKDPHAEQINDLNDRLAKVKRGLRNHQIALVVLGLIWALTETIEILL